MAEEEKVKVYISSVSSNRNIVSQQNRIETVLTSKGIQFEMVDLYQNPEYKEEMRKIIGDEKAVPPQICNGDQYCGDFDSFSEAVDDGRLEEFLKLNRS